MGKQNASLARFIQMRATVAEFLLQERCRIYPPMRVLDSAGSYTDVLGLALQYKGSPDIPCRLDVTRYYRQAQVFGQEAIISDFELHVPFDAPLHQDYKIQIDGQFYEIRKLMDAEDWRVTKYALVSRVGQGSAT